MHSLVIVQERGTSERWLDGAANALQKASPVDAGRAIFNPEAAYSAIRWTAPRASGHAQGCLRQTCSRSEGGTSHDGG